MTTSLVEDLWVFIMRLVEQETVCKVAIQCKNFKKTKKKRVEYDNINIVFVFLMERIVLIIIDIDD